MLVKNEDITVVIQGPLYIEDNSRKLYLKFKKSFTYFKNNSIYLGKHDNKLTNLVHKIVYSKLPDSIKSLGINNNINRQVVSTINEVQTKYVLKIRANFSLDFKSSLFLIDLTLIYNFHL